MPWARRRGTRARRLRAMRQQRSSGRDEWSRSASRRSRLLRDSRRGRRATDPWPGSPFEIERAHRPRRAACRSRRGCTWCPRSVAARRAPARRRGPSVATPRSWRVPRLRRAGWSAGRLLFFELIWRGSRPPARHSLGESGEEPLERAASRVARVGLVRKPEDRVNDARAREKELPGLARQVDFVERIDDGRSVVARITKPAAELEPGLDEGAQCARSRVVVVATPPRERLLR